MNFDYSLENGRAITTDPSDTFVTVGINIFVYTGRS